ncbi:Ser-Thr-rich GPI-anchored membrane family protein [Streptomyces sp. NPDC002589]|uniref:Ser-Thr-rich GPI-anchored membrane family protein n=1 Tax=Streptomyces sp. NPDC002589 TaxID=3154420 RepID=UPI003329940E
MTLKGDLGNMFSPLPIGPARWLSRMPIVLALSAAAVIGTTAAKASAVEGLTINTPSNPVVCQPLTLSWSGGQGPYRLEVLPGNQPSAPPLRDLGEQDGTTYTWTVDVPQGTSLGLKLQDSTGAIAQSAPFTVQDGPDKSCLH